MEGREPFRLSACGPLHPLTHEPELQVLWVNRITGAVLIALTIPLGRISGDYPEMARLFPRLLLILIAFLATIMIVRSFIPAVAPVGEGEGVQSLAALMRPLITFGLLLVAIAATAYSDFFIAMIVLSALLVPVLGIRIREWLSYAFACLVLMLFVYGLFVVFLKVPLTDLRPPGF